MPGWKSVEEIIAYQLAVKFRDWILRLVDAGIFPKDWEFREQLTSAARSVPGNIAEGFALYKHGRFAYHLDVALGSLGESRTHLQEANTRGFLADSELDGLLNLAEEVRRTTLGLKRHLKTTEAPDPWSGSHVATPKPARKRR